MGFFRSRIFVAGMASTVTALVVGGVAWATIPNSTTGTITACYPTSGASKGALRVIDAQAGAHCLAGEGTITWPTRGFRWRGTWSGVTAYGTNDVVRYNGAAYVALKPGTNVIPTDTTYWSLMVSKGDSGATGAQGAAAPAPTVRQIELGPAVIADDGIGFEYPQIDVHDCAHLTITIERFTNPAVAGVLIEASQAGVPTGIVANEPNSGSVWGSGQFWSIPDWTPYPTVRIRLSGAQSGQGPTNVADAWAECQTFG